MKKISQPCRFILVVFFLISFSTFAEAANFQDVKAAANIAKQNRFCQGIVPFYWEIGNGNKVLASGSTGDGSITRDSTFNIASASKWVFGAYVIQRLYGKLDLATQKYLRMMSGYNSLRVFGCIFTRTIQQCFNRGDNSNYTPANDGKFYYNGGHFQKWAVLHGMGPLTRSGLVAEYQKQLGSDIQFSVGPMQLAGALKTSAKYYAIFLQKILRGQLLIKNFLGANATCTLPRVCSHSVRSPIPVAWHYSYGHWVEDDANGDGSFSSPGAFGFYPWIDKTKQYYGIISRHQRPHRENREIGAGYASYLCGRAIRRAFLHSAM